MNTNAQLAVRGGQSLVPGDFKLKFGSIGPNGYEYTPGIEITEHQMLEEADRLAGGFAYLDFIGSKREVIIGTFVRNSELKFGEAASQVYAKFGMKEARLKNVLQVIDHVPIQLVNNPNVSFEVAYEVAHIKDKNGKPDVTAQTDLLTLAADNKLTVKETRVARKAYLAERESPTDPATDAPPAPEKVSPFHFTFTFAPPESKESLKDYAGRVLKAITAAVAEAVKRYMQPKYAAQQAAKERSEKFTALMKGIPKEDQAPFLAQYESDIPISAIGRAVNDYNGKKAARDALNALLNTVVDEARREEFRQQATGVIGDGKDIPDVAPLPLKTVEANVKAWNKRAVNVKAVEAALDEAKIMDTAERQSFIAQLDAEPAVKLGTIKADIKKAGKAVASAADNEKEVNKALDAAKITDEAVRQGFIARLATEKLNVIKIAVKKAGKDALAEAVREKGVFDLLQTIPEDQREAFLGTADVSASVKDFKERVTSWNSAKASENKKAVDLRRKEREITRKKITAMCNESNEKKEFANKLRETGIPENVAKANQIDAEADQISVDATALADEADAEEIKDKQLMGIPMHPKPSKADRKVGKKTAKKRAKHSKR